MTAVTPATTSAPLLTAVAVRKWFGRTEVLRAVDLTVDSGTVTCLIGPSGSGKTTFLRCINQLETFDAGHIIIDGQIVGRRERRGQMYRLSPREQARQRVATGMVFQHFNLFPHMTVLENIVKAPRMVKKESKADAIAHAMALLEQVGLAHKASSYPAQLSGGQQQRVAIARALAMRPKLLLLDEPTSALDPETTGEVLGVLKTLAENGATMIVVTHEMSFARQVANSIVFMEDGLVVSRGTPDEMFSNNVDPRVRGFITSVL